ncbi:hypothetical protein F4777DRAFT_549120 [Nemania sp. FL0916]|nr:hypothetical protein F4777DRAFT_549120 [Nemania sp. FL0916]
MSSTGRDDIPTSGHTTPVATMIQRRTVPLDNNARTPGAGGSAQETESMQGLRLEDISRRSACDRCRYMKMRCERDQTQYINQLQQCNRCRQAGARCITTLEAERQAIHGTNQRSRKRRRQCAVENTISNNDNNNNTLAISATQSIMGNEQLEKMPQEQGRLAIEESTQSQSAAPEPLEHPMSPLLDMYFDCFDHRNPMDFDISFLDLISGAENDHSGNPAAMPPQASYAASRRLLVASDAPVMSCSGVDPTTAISAAVPNAPPPCPISYGHHEPDSCSDLPGPAPDHTVAASTAPMDLRCTMTKKLMEFNASVSHDIHNLRSTTTNWSSSHNSDTDRVGLLVRTLEHADTILEMLRTLTRLKPTPPSSTRSSVRSFSPQPRSSVSTTDGASWCEIETDDNTTLSWSSNSSSGGSNSDRGIQVDTDMALPLLTSIMNVSNLFQLCAQLATPITPEGRAHPSATTTTTTTFTTATTATVSAPEATLTQKDEDEDEAQQRQMLLSLRLEGLRTLEGEKRFQVLLHICLLKYTAMQNELRRIRRPGMLTKRADEAFRVVLGNGTDGESSLEVDGLVDSFRRLIMDEGELSLGS